MLLPLLLAASAYGFQPAKPALMHHRRATGRQHLSPRLAAQEDKEWTPPPGLEPDAIVLLWYYGCATVFRSAAYRFQVSGLPWKKLNELGWDWAAMQQAFGGAAALAWTWVLAGLLTGVFDEARYRPGRVGLTWLIAAPSAQVVKYLANWNSGDGSFKTGEVCAPPISLQARPSSAEHALTHHTAVAGDHRHHHDARAHGGIEVGGGRRTLVTRGATVRDNAECVCGTCSSIGALCLLVISVTVLKHQRTRSPRHEGMTSARAGGWTTTSID